MISEQPLTVILNGQELVTLLCTPEHLEDLTIGYLFGEGLITGWEDIESLMLNMENDEVSVITGPVQEKTVFKRYLSASAGKGVAFNQFDGFQGCGDLPDDHRVESIHIIEMMNRLQENSHLHRETGGVHTVALGEAGRLRLQRDDIGRHNAVDKVVGHCLRHGIEVGDKILLLSGRVSSEIASKAVKMGIQVLVSKSAPTDLAIDLRKGLG